MMMRAMVLFPEPEFADHGQRLAFGEVERGVLYDRRSSP